MRKIMMFLLLAAVGSTASPLLGQSSTQGAIGGTVFDTTDAVVPKAAVTIHNDATNAEIHFPRMTAASSKPLSLSRERTR